MCYCSLLVEINLTLRVLYIIAYINTYMQLQKKAFYKTFFPSKRGSAICIMFLFDDKNIVYLLSVDPVNHYANRTLIVSCTRDCT